MHRAGFGSAHSPGTAQEQPWIPSLLSRRNKTVTWDSKAKKPAWWFLLPQMQRKVLLMEKKKKKLDKVNWRLPEAVASNLTPSRPLRATLGACRTRVPPLWIPLELRGAAGIQQP